MYELVHEAGLVVGFGVERILTCVVRLVFAVVVPTDGIYEETFDIRNGISTERNTNSLSGSPWTIGSQKSYNLFFASFLRFRLFCIESGGLPFQRNRCRGSRDSQYTICDSREVRVRIQTQGG